MTIRHAATSISTSRLASDLGRKPLNGRVPSPPALRRRVRAGAPGGDRTCDTRFSVTNPGALLDLWAEENVERPRRTLAHLLAQTPQQLIKELATNLVRAGIDYALTGAGAASLVAPFITAVPVVEVSVTATAAPEELYDGAKADPVTDGQNIVFLQAKDDTPLAGLSGREYHTDYDRGTRARCERALLALLGDLGPLRERC